MVDRVPAEVFPPGEFLRDELEARNWTQAEFAEIIGRPPRLVNEIIAGKRGLTPATAKEIGAALGTSPIFWLNLEAAYQLAKVEPAAPRIALEGSLREKFPVRDMLKRGWIAGSESPQALERELLRFFRRKSIDDAPRFAYAARKTDYAIAESPRQEAWLRRVQQLAETIRVPSFSKMRLRNSLKVLRAHLIDADGVRHVPRVLADCGVRFVIVEPLPGSKIDGACFWLPGSAAAPVIGMSLRFDRIDNFWFVLRHEIEHVLNGDGKDVPIIDLQVDDSDGSAPVAIDTREAEIAANDAAGAFLVEADDVTEFLDSVPPRYREARLAGFASRFGVHPGILAGRVQRRTGSYDMFRRHLARIRHLVVPESVCDGYDQLGSE